MDETKVTVQEIGFLKIFINDTICLNRLKKEQLIKVFDNHYRSIFLSGEYSEAIYFSTECNLSNEISVNTTIRILYNGIYQTLTNYKHLFPFISNGVEQLKNSDVFINEKRYKIAVISFDIVPKEKLLSLLEKTEATLLKIKNDGKFIQYENEEEIVDNIKLKISDNFYFINCHRATNFPEIDPKLLEARLAFASGLPNTSISILCITLEEMLKTILKYNYITSNTVNTEEPSLLKTKHLTNKAQKKYGSKTMEECIYLAVHEGLINYEEKKSLKRIYDYLRNALIHSDKSKLFSNDKTEVTLVDMKNGKMKVVESKFYAPNDIIYIQGYLQQYLAHKFGREIFHEIEDLIYEICHKFWKKLK